MRTRPPAGHAATGATGCAPVRCRFAIAHAARAVPWVLAAFVAVSCSRPRAERAAADARAIDSTKLEAIASDRPERLVVPLAGGRGGTLTLERVGVARAAIEHAAAAAPPPSALPGSEITPPDTTALAPPAAEPGETAPEPAGNWKSLAPPIPRGMPLVASGGRGGRVTLDVRVDDRGEVTDAVLVESDADSLTVAAAIESARILRFHPALLGGRPVAVWTRQTFEVARESARGRASAPRR